MQVNAIDRYNRALNVRTLDDLAGWTRICSTTRRSSGWSPNAVAGPDRTTKPRLARPRFPGWLRCQEALDLMIKDIDFDRSVITIRRGKGGRMRRVGMDAGTSAVLQQWLEARAKLRLPRSAPVLCTLKGEPLHPSYVRHLMRRLGRKAGIEKRAHFTG